MNPRLQAAQAWLRRTRLLPLVMAGRFAAEVAVNYPANRRFSRAHPDFAVPPARLAFDAYGNVNRDFYLRSGQERAADIATLVRKHTDVLTPAVLEWGCGAARVLRHLVDELPGSVLAGSDYNRETISWCQANVPDVRFELNGLAPPLACDDAEFDFVYAISVLTHLSEPMQFAWLDELRRVTKPGGVIAVSVKGESFRPILLPDELAAWERGELVVREGAREGKRMYGAFHPERFMRERLLAGAEVLEHIPSSNQATQDFWLVRRA